MAITTLNLRALNRSDTASSGQLVTATSATAMDFQDAAGAGKILQVVNASTTTGVNVATNAYTDTSLTANITPSATSSKILLTVCHQNFNSSTPSHILSWRILRDSTVIWHAGGWASGPWSLMGWQGDRPAQHASISLSAGYTIGYTWVDSPSSTSALTYKTQMVNGNNTTGYAGTQSNAGNGAPAGHITLMEIDGS